MNLEDIVNTPFVSVAPDMKGAMEGMIRAFFYEGNAPEEPYPFPENTIYETEGGTLTVNLEKITEWAATLPWLEVPSDRDERAMWLIRYQHGAEEAATVEAATFGYDGNLVIKLKGVGDAA